MKIFTAIAILSALYTMPSYADSCSDSIDNLVSAAVTAEQIQLDSEKVPSNQAVADAASNSWEYVKDMKESVAVMCKASSSKK
jgi:hypothetical protein